MHRINSLVFVSILLVATLTSAQAPRTWVSGLGDDTNPCSRGFPCQTWAGAISKTAPNGEVDALDAGDFGPVTISSGITLDGGEGQGSSALISGTTGITVAAGPNDVVILRNLRINGIRSGLNGISFVSGKELSIENCVIVNFLTNGINISLSAAGTAHISNSVLKNNGSCAPGSCTSGVGNGIFATSSAGTVLLSVSNTQVALSPNNGIEAGSNSRINVNRSSISASGFSGVMADGTTGTCNIAVDYSEIINGNNGATASVAGCFVNVANTTIAYNSGTAYNPIGNGKVIAFALGGTTAANGTNFLHDVFVGTPVYKNLQ